MAPVILNPSTRQEWVVSFIHRQFTPSTNLIILLPMHKSQKWSHPFRFLRLTFCMHFSFLPHMLRPMQIILLDLATLLIYGKVYKWCSFSKGKKVFLIIHNSCKNYFKIYFNIYYFRKYIRQTETITAQSNIWRIPKTAYAYIPMLTRDFGRPELEAKPIQLWQWLYGAYFLWRITD